MFYNFYLSKPAPQPSSQPPPPPQPSSQPPQTSSQSPPPSSPLQHCDGDTNNGGNISNDSDNPDVHEEEEDEKNARTLIIRNLTFQTSFDEVIIS